MTERHLDEELTFREAAAALKRKRDPSGRRLRNMVMARERQTGKAIAVRLGGSVEPKTRVTLGALYRAFPEFRRDRVDELGELVRPLVERAEDRARSIVRDEISERVEPRILKLEKRSRILERAILELAALEADN